MSPKNDQPRPPESADLLRMLTLFESLRRELTSQRALGAADLENLSAKAEAHRVEREAAGDANGVRIADALARYIAQKLEEATAANAAPPDTAQGTSNI